MQKDVRLEEIKGKIEKFLLGENIKFEKFIIGRSEELNEVPTSISIKIDEDDKNKWVYFMERLNESFPIADYSSTVDTFTITFRTPNDEFNRELLVKDLQHFYETLQKKYYKVCPKVDTFNVLVKPTHRCQLDCRYCYDKPYRESIKCDMSMEVLDRILKLLSEYTRKIYFIWHGGEPTLVGIRWYQKAFDEVIPKYPMLDIDFHIMSNGLNLDKEWLDFCDKYDIKLGASYNAYYQTQLRHSSQPNSDEEKELQLSEKIENALMLSVKRGKPIGVIDVVTGKNYKNYIELYEFYKQRGLEVSFNPLFHTPEAEKNGLEVSAEEMSREFLKFFEYWLYDKNGTHERIAVEYINLVIGGTNLTCKHSDCRYRWLCFNPIGEIYPCDRYYPERYKAGNVFEINSIEDAFNSPGYKLYAGEVQERFDTVCRECGFLDICKGGCNASAIESSGSAKGVEEFDCELFRLNFKGVYKILRNLDWIDNKDLNPHAYKTFLENGFYSVKEIKDYLKEAGIDFEMEYDENDLLNCSEYQIFRGINYNKTLKSKYNRHVDIINSFDDEAIKINKAKRKEDFFKYLSSVAESVISQLKPLERREE